MCRNNGFSFANVPGSRIPVILPGATDKTHREPGHVHIFAHIYAYSGATRVMPEVVESSLRLGAEALQMLGVTDENIEELLQCVRGSDYALVQESGDRDSGG